MRESRVRDLARQAAREAKGDSTEMVLALDRRVRERWGDFESFPVTIVQDDDLLVALTAPYLSFRTSLIDMLRSGRAIQAAVWTNAVTVTVTPKRLGAPDIESVAVSRNDRPIPPIRNALRPMRFSDGTGKEGVLHAGDVSFPTSAFAPGGNVVVALAPRDRVAIDRALSDADLRMLK
jgi:hypothetical protein